MTYTKKIEYSPILVARSTIVKLCVSSRPSLVFDQAFKQFPTLSLQNLTFEDIKMYIRAEPLKQQREDAGATR
jgi:hypothetical protein